MLELLLSFFRLPDTVAHLPYHTYGLTSIPSPLLKMEIFRQLTDTRHAVPSRPALAPFPPHPFLSTCSLPPPFPRHPHVPPLTCPRCGVAFLFLRGGDAADAMGPRALRAEQERRPGEIIIQVHLVTLCVLLCCSVSCCFVVKLFSSVLSSCCMGKNDALPHFQLLEFPVLTPSVLFPCRECGAKRTVVSFYHCNKYSSLNFK